MEGLSVVIEHANPALLTRLGLRYLDAVIPSEGEKIEQYLCNGLHGVDLDLSPIQSVNEMVFQTNVGPVISTGFLVTRLHKMFGQLSFPPDILPFGVEMLERFRSDKALWHGIIDTDHYVEGNMPPEIDSIEQQFNSLHDVVKESFNKMVSQHAINRWV